MSINEKKNLNDEDLENASGGFLGLYGAYRLGKDIVKGAKASKARKKMLAEKMANYNKDVMNKKGF